MTLDIESSKQIGLEIYQILSRSACRCRSLCLLSVASHSCRGNHLPGFSREIAGIGVGPLHGADLTPDEVEIAIRTQQGSSVHVRTNILWCQPCHPGWYKSGGEFVGMTRIGW